MTADLAQFLAEAVARGASDLHLVAGCPPMIRVHGVLQPLADALVLSAENTRQLVLGVLGDGQRGRLEEEWELDFALEVETVGRFRGNAHYNRGALEAAFRHIPIAVPALDSLGHRPSISRIPQLEADLVLVTGVTGSGKSTTVAAIVNAIAVSRPAMIITVEDPIEFLFPSPLGIVKQREVGNDTRSFAEALRHVLRQDPDVIVVGEMRDLETIRAAITAAETGHLVLATLHTIDAPKAVDRIVDAFPGDQQPQIVAQLANALEVVVSQRLLPNQDGTGRVLATEMLTANTAVRACIRERRYEQLVGLIEIGAKDGMHTIDDSLAELFLGWQITKDVVMAHARDRKRFEGMVREGQKKRGLFA